ncbi:MAG TPA: hypothetical protein V6C65_20170, partial [Allocoleopsis sp.]
MVESSSVFGNWFTGKASLRLEATETTAVSSSGLTLTPDDYQALLDEVTQLQEEERKRIARIEQLEQALDQTLAHLDELREQLKEQTFLENQLATTEEYANVQQQAIARFKLQIAEQQQVLDTQILETQQRDQAIQELMA